MKFIVKLFPEITIKSDSVRLRFIKILTSSIRNILTAKINVAVIRHWDFIEVRIKEDNDHDLALDLLTKIPGIHHILEVEELNFENMHDIYLKTQNYFTKLIENKTFCVRVKRRGKHDFTSIEVERYVGGGLNQSVLSAKVKLNKPDVTVNLEIDNDKLLIVKNRFLGIGGFPLGTQEDVLSLISGGFDSSVSSYHLIRRGSRVHYCFFNLGGKAHEIGVKAMAYYLWQRFGSSHKVRFIAIDFSDVVGEILEKIDNAQMGVILKRMMVRSASTVAKKYGVQALVTGEALGQVSSQTLTNLRIIDNATDTLILRPLITHDKEHIIKIAREIGTEDMAKTMPEFCGVISKKPTVKAVASEIEAEENKFNFEILDKAVANLENIDIREIAKETDTKLIQVDAVNSIAQNEIIIDIRSPEEQEENPLLIENAEIKIIPYYKLKSNFSKLDQNKTYLLYCQKGVMSKLQALYLIEQGFNNVKVFKK